MKVSFLMSASISSPYPETNFPEIAIVGKSNCGKSSLINRLIQRKNFVRTAKTPGRTKLVNFIQINEELVFVDLPGFGYAKVSLKEKKGWKPMIERYLLTREQLKLVLYLFDIRRTPGEEDKALVNWFYENGIPFNIVFTKVDKFKRSVAIKTGQQILKDFGFINFTPYLTSSTDIIGIENLWQLIRSRITEKIEEEITPEPTQNGQNNT